MKLGFLKRPLRKDVNTKKLQWKFLRLTKRGNVRSHFGRQTWEIGKWYSRRGWIRMCKNGFHSSPTINDANYWVSGEVLALVEYDGESHEEGYRPKRVSEKMRIVRAWHVSDDFQNSISIFYFDSNNERKIRGKIKTLREVKLKKK